MALAMRDLLRRDFRSTRSHLEVRIGIGTGPIVAGVLGKKKFIYDLWGDTVNIASRITSEGVPGMIQCDTTTYHRLATVRIPRAADHLPQGQGQHDGVSADRPQGALAGAGVAEGA
jgi:class 3 adenylate cyclase